VYLIVLFVYDVVNHILRHFISCLKQKPYDIIVIWRIPKMIKENRNKKGYTQEELAELIGISWRQLQRIEKHEEQTKITTLKKLIKILDIPDKELLKFMKNTD
jgi:DNA-binding XRE family transcriptional regulator